MWFYVHNRADFVGRDVEAEPHFRLRSEPDNIADPESSQPHSRTFFVLMDKDCARALKRVLDCGELFRVAAILPVSKFEIVFRWTPDASAKPSRDQFSIARAMRTCSGLIIFLVMITSFVILSQYVGRSKPEKMQIALKYGYALIK